MWLMERSSASTNVSRFWWIAVCLVLAVQAWFFYLPAVPGEAGSLFAGADKVGHALSFAALAGALVLTRTSWPIILGISIGHAILSEVIQSFMPTRSGSVLDFLADCAGIAFGIVVALHVRSSTASTSGS